MKRTYRNAEGRIGIEFQYEDEYDFGGIFEGLAFELLHFVEEYNMTEELIEHLKNPTYYFAGETFKAVDIGEEPHAFDKFMGEDWKYLFRFQKGE